LGGSDAVFSNPPLFIKSKQKKAKVCFLNKYFDALLKKKVKMRLAFFKKFGFYNYSEGMLNCQILILKLF
jgi:hypothetical protein